jgi:hypothetical protein
MHSHHRRTAVMAQSLSSAAERGRATSSSLEQRSVKVDREDIYGTGNHLAASSIACGN